MNNRLKIKIALSKIVADLGLLQTFAARLDDITDEILTWPVEEQLTVLEGLRDSADIRHCLDYLCRTTGRSLAEIRAHRSQPRGPRAN